MPDEVTDVIVDRNDFLAPQLAVAGMQQSPDDNNIGIEISMLRASASRRRNSFEELI